MQLLTHHASDALTVAGVGCLRNSVDITDGIPKESVVNFCKGCERFLSPPNTWVACQPESRELLGEYLAS